MNIHGIWDLGLSFDLGININSSSKFDTIWKLQKGRGNTMLLNLIFILNFNF